MYTGWISLVSYPHMQWPFELLFNYVVRMKCICLMPSGSWRMTDMRKPKMVRYRFSKFSEKVMFVIVSFSCFCLFVYSLVICYVSNV